MAAGWLERHGDARRHARHRDSASGTFLETVMWTGIARRGRFARPVLFDHPLLRRWLAVEPTRCMDYLRAEWGNLRAPDHPEEALALLARPGCFAAGLGEHRIASEHALHDGGWAFWIVGACPDCHQAILQCHDQDDDFMRSWPFYDHEAVGHRPGGRTVNRHSLPGSFAAGCPWKEVLVTVGG